MSSSSSLYTAQILGLTAAAFHSGVQWTISHIGIPPVLAAKDPQTKVHLWHAMWLRGARTGPPAMVVASTILAYAAYLAPNSATRRLWAIAAICPALMMPFTYIVIEPTNQYLLGRAAAFEKNENAKAEDDRQITDAVNKWRDLNYVRAAMPIAATGIALWGLLN